MSFRSKRLLHKMKSESYKDNISHTFLKPNQKQNLFSEDPVYNDNIKKIDNGQIVTLDIVSKPDNQLLYFHGGAFTAPMNADQLEFITNLAQRTNSQLKIIDFPLLLSHKSTEIIDFCVKAFDECVADSLPINLVGDSAGAYLMLQVATRRAAEVNRIVAISPWLDLELANSSVHHREADDVFLELDVLQTIGKQFDDGLVEGDVVDLFMEENLSGLKIQLFYGDNEMLVPDNQIFVDAMNSAVESEIEVVEFNDIFHDYILWTKLSETKKTEKLIAEFLGR